MVRITFLGTGGGRFIMISQERATGGFIFEMGGERIHVDPGPGAVVRAKQFRADIKKLSGVVISHCHPDHYTDAEIIIESMTNGARIKRGYLITIPESVESLDRKPVSKYHTSTLERVIVMRPGQMAIVGGLEVTATPAKHREAQSIGFVFQDMKTKERFGYVSDTEHFPGIEKYYEGCQCLVMNVLRPRGSNWPGHMNIPNAAAFLKAMKTKPKLAILQHFGEMMLEAGPEKEAQWVQDETGVRTIAAVDGMVTGT